MGRAFGGYPRGEPPTAVGDRDDGRNDMAVDVRAMGRAGLTGWRGKMASKVAEPVAHRTPLRKIDVEALIGWAFLALTVLQFVKLARTAVRAGREASR
jgi:hypothetical protein